MLVIAYLVLFVGVAATATVMGILQPGIWWALYIPAFLLASLMSGRVLGVVLGLNPFVGTLLAGLGLGLDLAVMNSGIGWALLKAFVIFLMFEAGATCGWFRAVDQRSESRMGLTRSH